MNRLWRELKNNWVPWSLLTGFIVGVGVLLVLVYMSEQDSEKDLHKQQASLCKKLRAEYVTEPDRLCVKNYIIVHEFD